jgi:hypothetical protein
LTTFLGIGAAIKARKCLAAGRELVKIASVIDAGIATYRFGQGIDAYMDGRANASNSTPIVAGGLIRTSEQAYDAPV